MKIKSVKHNYIVKSLSLAASVIVPLITYPYVSRVIGPSGIGKVEFANSVVYYFQIIAQLGIPMYGIRACAKVRDDKEKLSRTAQEIIIINLVTFAVSFALLFLSINLVPQLRVEKKLLYVVSLSILFNTISVDWLYSALEQYDFLAISSVAMRLAMIPLMFLLIKSEEDYVKYGLLTVLNAAGYGVINFISLRRFIILKPLGNYSFSKHLRPIGTFMAMSIATTIYTRMDTVMIGFINGTTENGFYDAAVKVKTILVSFITTLGSVMLPRVSFYLEKGEREKFYDMSSKALDFVVLVSIPCTVFFIMFASQTVMFLSGEQFANSVLPMQLIMPSIIFIGITGITGIQMMIPLGKEKSVLYSEIVGAVVNLVINSLLIPKMGAAGAAIGTVAAEFAVLVCQFITLKDVVFMLIKKIGWVKIAFANLIAVFLSLWCSNLVLGAVLFFAGYAVSLVLMREKMALEACEALRKQIHRKI